ncbi:glyoxalase superfamily protein [Halomonas maura]|uniref:glyoxalase superfamily protein n=1 Tax=Halomonas maura TaxID=117606 RepID=UPI0025B45F4F|nr:glyoxalase superfamily protein [Halomonas maura]MDN3556259.1 glyoxalase superfamily protein [Halomonas maura]
MSLGRTTPILRIFDEAKAREFYVDFLGFAVDWQHRLTDDLPLYLQVSRDDCVLHLSEHHGDASPGTTLRIEAREIAAFHRELLGAGYRYARPALEAMPWGSSEMSIADPFGNRLIFTSAIDD